MGAYDEDYADLDAEDLAAEREDLEARLADLAARSAPVGTAAPPEQVPAPAFDPVAHQNNVASLVAGAPQMSEEAFWAEANRRGLTAEAVDGAAVPAGPTPEAKAALLEPGLSEGEFWRRAHALGLATGARNAEAVL